MKLIIDIPEEDYIRLRDEGMFGNVTTFKRAVREGIPLAQEPLDVSNMLMVVINNRLNDLSERVENIEKQMREDREGQLKELKAELDYAKFRCALPTI